ncbi:MAG TPA: isocitrate/isopropylmalate family dehydrogenase [Vicinamibacterales bacterium]|nr:isocitrate/isopropylmalate family dehydrogenase [Vicinamibacterales bacterium]
MNLVVLPGDGIGPEITAATLDALSAVNGPLSLGLTFETHDIGLRSLDANGTTLTDDVLDACRTADGIILGPVSHATYPSAREGGINPSAAIRIALDLYANIRPSRSHEGLPHYGRTPMDLVIVRENTEGFYADRNMYDGGGEFMPTPDVALAVRKITAKGSARIVQAAFDLARSRRRHVTAVHKQNVLRMSDGLFLNEARRIAAANTDVAYEEQLVDSMTALLIRHPARYDVIVATNMFGDILSDEASELSGGLGLGASVNAGDAHCMAQAQHGSAPHLAGTDQANPTSLMLSAAMLLDWLARRHDRSDLARAARVVTDSVDVLLARPETRTADLDGALGTRDFTKSLIHHITRSLDRRS